MRRKNFIPYLYSILILISVVGLTFINTFVINQYQIRDKFAIRYVAAKQWMGTGASPYAEEVSDLAESILLERQYENINQEDTHLFEPVYFILFYLPLSLLKFSIAKAIWMTLIELALIFLVILSIQITGWRLHWLEKVLLILLVLLSYPAVKGILFGDPLIITVFILIFVVYLIQKGHDTSTGLLLAVFAFSSEIAVIFTLFILAWSLSRGMKAVAFTFLAGLATMVVISLLFFGNWFPVWGKAFINLYPGINWLQTPLMRISNTITGAERQLNLILHIGLILFMLLEWFGAFGKKGRIFVWKISLTLVIIYFLNFWSKPGYLLLTIPGLFFMLRFFSERWKLFGKIFSWILIIGIFVLYWSLFNTRGSWFSVDLSLVLLLLPAIVFIGLQWIRWWALKLPPVSLPEKIKR